MSRAARVVVVAVAAIGLGVGAAQASSSDDPLVVSYSPNWSGYVATGPAGSPVNYSSVTGTWTVPTVTCGPNDAGAFSVVSIGLGGYTTTQKMEEVGTDANCDGTGKPTYYAWFELVPYIAYNVPAQNKVFAGDTITGLVKVLNDRLVRLQIQNQTRGWTFSRDINWTAPDTSSAEWIVVAPASCLRFKCHQANLANFGAAAMRGISAVGDSLTGTLTDPDWRVIPLQLVPAPLNVPNLGDESLPAKGRASSQAGATPGAVSADGSSFSITWLPVSTRGL